jgi:hypothetical protein
MCLTLRELVIKCGSSGVVEMDFSILDRACSVLLPGNSKGDTIIARSVGYKASYIPTSRSSLNVSMLSAYIESFSDGITSTRAPGWFSAE